MEISFRVPFISFVVKVPDEEEGGRKGVDVFLYMTRLRYLRERGEREKNLYVVELHLPLRFTFTLLGDLSVYPLKDWLSSVHSLPPERVKEILQIVDTVITNRRDDLETKLWLTTGREITYDAGIALENEFPPLFLNHLKRSLGIQKMSGLSLSCSANFTVYYREGWKKGLKEGYISDFVKITGGISAEVNIAPEKEQSLSSFLEWWGEQEKSYLSFLLDKIDELCVDFLPQLEELLFKVLGSQRYVEVVRTTFDHILLDTPLTPQERKAVTSAFQDIVKWRAEAYYHPLRIWETQIPKINVYREKRRGTETQKRVGTIEHMARAHVVIPYAAWEKTFKPLVEVGNYRQFAVSLLIFCQMKAAELLYYDYGGKVLPKADLERDFYENYYEILENYVI